MTLFRLALRSHLGGVIATTWFGAVIGLANALGYVQVAGTDPASRLVFARQMELLGKQLLYLLPDPVELETMAGYLQWRVFGVMGIIYAFWAIIAASGAGRGDEERGLVETWLATGLTRLRYIAARAAAFVIVAAASIVLTIVATWLATIAANDTIAFGPLILQGVDLLALTSVCFGITLCVAQVRTTRRAAGGVAGILVLALYLVNSGARTGGLEEIRGISPFWWYDRSQPMLRAGHFDVAATIGLAVAAVVLLLVAVWAFAARDLDASLVRMAPSGERRSTRPSRDPLLRLPVFAAIDQQRAWILGWMIGTAALGAYLLSITKAVIDTLASVPTMRIYLERLGSAGYDTFVATIWGSTALFLLSLFAIFQVNSWVADDAEGRLDAALSQPVARTRVALERLASLGLAAAFVIVSGTAAVWYAARATEITLSASRFVTGSALMVLVPLAFGAIGALIAGWRPRAAVPVLTIVAFVSYFSQQFAPLFDWPAWVERTSLFALYGTPLATDVDATGTAILVAVVVLGALLGVVLFQRRDVGR